MNGSGTGSRKRPIAEATNDGRDESARTGHSTTTVSECPYLDSVNRSLLDFDFEPACCVSLAKGPNIYACLVCGKFYLGRSTKTPAFVHAVSVRKFETGVGVRLTDVPRLNLICFHF
jgi:U4/U6.U5 tri-snRNP-associated protein 2